MVVISAVLAGNELLDCSIFNILFEKTDSNVLQLEISTIVYEIRFYFHIARTVDLNLEATEIKYAMLYIFEVLL